MNIFDSSDITKQIKEEELKWVEGDKPKEEVKEEAAPELAEVEEDTKEPAETLEQEQEQEDEEEERPTDGAGWKRLREKKKAAAAEAERQRELAEKRDKENQELRERLARLEGREEARVAPKVDVDTDPEPDQDIDPDAHIRWQLRQTQKDLAEVKKKAEEAAANSVAEATRRGLTMVENEFVKSNNLDDYQAAIDHIKAVETNLIKLRYPNATDAQINSHLEAERLKIAQEVYGKGQNPADHFYKMAQAIGYKKAPKDGKKIDDRPNIKALNKNMEKNSSLIGSSSAEKNGGVSSEKLVQMSIADLLNNEKALKDAIRKEELKWMNG